MVKIVDPGKQPGSTQNHTIIRNHDTEYKKGGRRGSLPGKG